jgi:hypothetical protein
LGGLIVALTPELPTPPMSSSNVGEMLAVATFLAGQTVVVVTTAAMIMATMALQLTAYRILALLFLISDSSMAVKNPIRIPCHRECNRMVATQRI